MATFYVAPDGDNGGAGTSLEPWATYTYGFSNISGSDTLIIGTGVYSENRSPTITPIPNGTIGNHTIITDAGDGVVTLRRSGGASGIIYFTDPGTAHGYISFIGTSRNQLVFDGQDVAGQANIYLGNASEGNSDFTFVNCEIKNAGASGALVGTILRPIFRDCDVHDNGTSPSQDHGLYLGGNNSGLVEGCFIYNNSANGLRHGGSLTSIGFIARGNRTWGNGTNGIIVYTANAAQIYNNISFLNGDAGVQIGSGSGTFVYHNTCHENHWGVLLGGFNNPSNTVVKNNLLVGNDIDLEITSRSTGASYAWNIMSTAVTNAGSGTTNGGNNITTAVVADTWVDPTNATPSLRDYNLKAGSAAIYNASTNNVPSVGVPTDFTGAARNFIDQGAYAYGSTTPPDPPIISHPGNEIVTHEFTDVSLTLTKGTNNIVTCTVSGTGGKAAISATPTNVTVARN